MTLTPAQIHRAGTNAVANALSTYSRCPVLARLSSALDVCSFALLLLAFVVGYVALCPADPIRHAVHVAGVVR